MTTTEDRKENLVYELSYLVLPSLAEEALSDTVDAIKGIIKKTGAQELDSENPVIMDLAYTMSKSVGSRKYVVDEAYIGWIKFETDGATITEISDAMKKLDEILRFLVIKAPRETTFTFAAALKAKEDKIKALEEAAAEASGLEASQEEKVVE